jgi:hypothetical protein
MQKIVTILSRVFLAPIVFMWIWTWMYAVNTPPTYKLLVKMNALLELGGLCFGFIILGVFVLIAAATGGKKQ